MGPVLDLILSHRVKDLSEFLNVCLCVLFRLHSFETVKFLIVEVEVAVVISFCAICVFAASRAILTIMMVVAILYGCCVAVNLAQNEHSAGQ